MKSRSHSYRFVAVAFGLIGLMGFLTGQCDSTDAMETEAVRFDRFARKAFKEVYPLLAEQILGDYGIYEGFCLDLGCGPGYLSIEIAKRSRLKILGIDIDAEAVQIAQRNVKREKLDERVFIEEGDVHRLRLADGTADLIVSRGSFLFWENIAVAFQEIFRVLKPGGVAFVGGGMGRAISPEQKEAIKLQVEEAGFLDRCEHMITPVMMQETLESLNIRNFKIFGDGPGDSGCQCGMWIEIRKSII